MTTAAEQTTWVGRPLLRVEDDALLRGEGRFLDDLEPAAHAGHAAIVRSQLPHARIAVDASEALAAPGVIGVLTGEDVVALSRPFPAGIDSPAKQYALAIDEVRYVGEPVAVVVATDRYLAEDAAELVAVDYDPLEPTLDAVAAAETAACVHDRSFHYGDVDEAMHRADLIVRETFTVPRFTCTPVECYAVVADWDETEGRLTAWANFQGPFTLHGVAAAALGLRGDRLRLLTPPDSGGSFGVKSAVFGYVVLVGLAARKLGVPVRWIEDRLEHLAASSAATGRVTAVEAGFTTEGELVALRYDAIEDVGAYVRAPEPATLYRMHGSLSGAYRVRDVAVRNRVVLTNTIPSGLNRGFGGPQLYFALERTMAIAARRLGIDPAALARRNLVPAEAMPYRTPSGALYDSGDYVACLEQALELSRYDELRAEVDAARADGRLAGLGLVCVVEPSISNMGYITLAQTAVERAGSLPKSGNAEGASIAIDPHGGITVRLATTPQGQGHRTVCAQVVADVLGCEPAAVTVLSEMDTATVPWTVASGNYSSRFSGVGVGAVQAAAAKLREKVDAIRAHAGDESLSLRRVAGMAHWNPEGLPAGLEPGLASVAYWSAPNLDPPDAEDRVASSAAHGFIVDVCAVEVDRETGAVRVLDYVTVHDAGVLLNPLLADGQVLGGFAHGVAAALFERHVYDEWGNLMTASLVDYLAPTAPDIPALRIGHRSTPSPFTALGAKGIGEGNTMSAPVCIANAVADAIGRDDVELPLTPPRVWELLRTVAGGRHVKPVAFDYVAAGSLDEALAALAEGGEDAKPIAGGQSLVPALNMRLVRPTLLVDLNRAGLGGIDANGSLRIGATARQATVQHDPRAHPLLREALPFVGHYVTRNRGTVGGSVAHADGSAEIPLCLAALGGTVVVAGPSGRRELATEDFFVTHYLTRLQPGELVVETVWPYPADDEGSAFEELALRAGDYAVSMVAVVLRRQDGVARDVRVTAGAVTDRPTALLEAAAALEGAEVTAVSARRAGAAAAASVDPPGSIHAGPGYLRSVTATLVERAARRAWERAG